MKVVYGTCMRPHPAGPFGLPSTQRRTLFSSGKAFHQHLLWDGKFDQEASSPGVSGCEDGPCSFGKIYLVEEEVKGGHLEAAESSYLLISPLCANRGGVTQGQGPRGFLPRFHAWGHLGKALVSRDQL